MAPEEIIRRKREGQLLNREEIAAFVQGSLNSSWSEAQLGAFLMAIVLRGMDFRETADLSAEMLDSGERILRPAGDLPWVDKHSTGGVGDKVSLVLAPLAIACGLKVPMISGRGLGHTGGTLDKLESIPGFRTDLTLGQMRAQLDSVGGFLVGQTDELAPADRHLYALRDVTATVESIPLICASIHSKKWAAGLDALVLDVKCGRGAFMQSREEALALAEALVKTGKAMGKPVRALITAMDAPLGRSVGNAVEVVEAIECLHGDGPEDLRDLSIRLTCEMLEIAGAANSSKAFVEERLTSGAALAKFAEIVEAQGGDPGVLEKPERLPRAVFVEDLFYEQERGGIVQRIDSRILAQSINRLGAGRQRETDRIDHSVGISHLVQPGEALEPGELIARIHFREGSQRENLMDALQCAIQLGECVEDLPSGRVLDQIG